MPQLVKFKIHQGLRFKILDSEKMKHRKRETD